MIWVDTLIAVNLSSLRLCFFYSWVVWGAFVELKRIITQVREAEMKARCEEAASPTAFKAAPRSRVSSEWVGTRVENTHLL